MNRPDRKTTATATSPRDYPAGYAMDAQRPDVFDPALKHYPYAFVKGPPPTGAEASELEEARALLLQRSLEGLSRSLARDAVVLRGGLTLAVWFPGRARRPHDIDLVVRNPAWEPTCAEADALLAEIRRAVRDSLVDAGATVVDEAITSDSIWTYERAEGRRITVPWTRAGGVCDVVQIDVVFREPLLDAPTLEPIGLERSRGGYREPGTAALFFASRAESLAWKLLWLEEDMYPQAKDLYDAVLLAEDVAISLDFVRRVFTAKGSRWEHDADTRFITGWDIDWDGFAVEYPELSSGDRGSWLARLARALGAGFAAHGGR